MTETLTTDERCICKFVFATEITLDFVITVYM